jgi:hypothetical protein
VVVGAHEVPDLVARDVGGVLAEDLPHGERAVCCRT